VVAINPISVVYSPCTPEIVVVLFEVPKSVSVPPESLRYNLKYNCVGLGLLLVTAACMCNVTIPAGMKLIPVPPDGEINTFNSWLLHLY